MKATETEKGYVTKRFPPALHLTHWETVAKSATRMRLYFRSMPCQQQLSEANKHRAQCNARNMGRPSWDIQINIFPPGQLPGNSSP